MSKKKNKSSNAKSDQEFMCFEEFQQKLRESQEEKLNRRVKEAIAIDKAREEARAARHALDEKDKDSKEQALIGQEAAAYKQLVLQTTACSPADLLTRTIEHALEIQGEPIIVPSGLISIIGRSVSGKSFAFQWRFRYATGSNPIVLHVGEPIPGALPPPVTKGDSLGLADAIRDLSKAHKVIILNSLTSLLSYDPSDPQANQATTGGSYAGLTSAIFRLDALAKELNILLIGVFNTAQFKEQTIDTVVGRSTAAFAIEENYQAKWSSRRYRIVESNAGLVIDEDDRSIRTFARLERDSVVTDRSSTQLDAADDGYSDPIYGGSNGI